MILLYTENFFGWYEISGGDWISHCNEMTPLLLWLAWFILFLFLHHLQFLLTVFLLFFLQLHTFHISLVTLFPVKLLLFFFKKYHTAPNSTIISAFLPTVSPEVNTLLLATLLLPLPPQVQLHFSQSECTMQSAVSSVWYRGDLGSTGGLIEWEKCDGRITVKLVDQQSAFSAWSSLNAPQSHLLLLHKVFSDQ